MMDILQMTRKEAAQRRKWGDAMRPKRPPTLREIVEARKKGYHFQNDLLTENALQWVLPKHFHSLDAVYEKCPWCVLERRIMTLGHMASLRPSPRWWKKFLEEVYAEKSAIMKIRGPYTWVPVEVSARDGRWWVFNAVDFGPPVIKARGSGPTRIRPAFTPESCTRQGKYRGKGT